MWCEMINSWLTACSSCGWLSYLQKYSHKISCINISRCDLDTGAGGGGAAAASVSSPKRDWERVRRLTWSISTVQYSTVQHSTVQYSTWSIWCSVNFFFLMSWVGAPWPGLQHQAEVRVCHCRGSCVTCQTSWIWTVPSAPPNLWTKDPPPLSSSSPKVPWIWGDDEICCSNPAGGVNEVDGGL